MGTYSARHLQVTPAHETVYWPPGSRCRQAGGAGGTFGDPGCCCCVVVVVLVVAVDAVEALDDERLRDGRLSMRRLSIDDARLLLLPPLPLILLLLGTMSSGMTTLERSDPGCAAAADSEDGVR